MNFDEAFTKLLGHEGGYVNHPNDPGGETNWGVTKAVARDFGYTGSMRDLPRDTAKRIYRVKYWDTVKADEMPAAVRYPLFDAAVNSGVGQAARWLQRALGVADDGKIGAITIAKAKQSDGVAVASAMIGQRLHFMTNLSTWPAFGKGWARRIASLMQEAA
jgi:lysozyme family protein